MNVGVYEVFDRWEGGKISLGQSGFSIGYCVAGLKGMYKRAHFRPAWASKLGPINKSVALGLNGRKCGPYRLDYILHRVNMNLPKKNCKV